jgi:hypothetical protein
MPRFHPVDQELLRARLEHMEQEARQRRSLYWQTLALCVLFLFLGLVLCGWGMHTTDRSWGLLAVNGGVLLADAGILGTLLWAYQRGES